jgi:RNA polymerase sigma-70 factor, ECF subfamily
MPEPANPDAVRLALSRLADAQGERLYATLSRLTLRGEVAGELLQELFLRLGRSGRFAAAGDPSAYAFRTAINLAMEWRRNRKAAAPMVSLAEATEIESGETSPLRRMVVSEEHERLLNALSEMSESDQRLFVLRFIDEQSYEVIAKEMGTTPHRARGLCHAAMRRLRDRVLPKGQIVVEKNHV